MTKLVFGLGNVGFEYQKNRHNVGFMVVDTYCAAKNLVGWKENELGYYLKDSKNNTIFAKPKTYMNNSGFFLEWLLHYFKLNLDDVLVVYDEIAFALGIIRLKANGSANGHNGLKSIFNITKTEQIKRLRFGISNSKAKTIPLKNFVLANFVNDEIELLTTTLVKTTVLLDDFVVGNDFMRLMNRYNTSEK